MKKAFSMPMIVVEQFVPNEYVSACGDENKVYKFVCDAGGGYFGGIWQESNGIEGLQTRGGWLDVPPYYYTADERLSRSSDSFHACGAAHDAPVKDDFTENCYYRNASTGEVISVIVWRGDGDLHATANLDMDSWTTAKS